MKSRRPTQAFALGEYEDWTPDGWEQALHNIHASGTGAPMIEAEKLRMQIRMMSMQAKIDLFTNDDANRRADTELEAAETRARASDTIARSLRTATWVLAAATVILSAATIVLAVRG